jgi:hypothetical protein
LLRDLRMVRSRYSAGVSSVVTPRSAESHADLAVALAIAAWELRHVRPDSGQGPRDLFEEIPLSTELVRRFGGDGSIGSPLRRGQSL